MRISTKYSIAIHLLIVISEFYNKKKLTGEELAASAGCHAVIARNILGELKKAGMINIPRGQGGAYLLKDPKDISMWDIYNTVEDAPLNELIGLHPNPSQKCPVGQAIYSVLEEPYEEIGEVIKQKMQTITLERMIHDYREKKPKRKKAI